MRFLVTLLFALCLCWPMCPSPVATKTVSMPPTPTSSAPGAYSRRGRPVEEPVFPSVEPVLPFLLASVLLWHSCSCTLGTKSRRLPLALSSSAPASLSGSVVGLPTDDVSGVVVSPLVTVRVRRARRAYDKMVVLNKATILRNAAIAKKYNFVQK